MLVVDDMSLQDVVPVPIPLARMSSHVIKRKNLSAHPSDVDFGPPRCFYPPPMCQKNVGCHTLRLYHHSKGQSHPRQSLLLPQNLAPHPTNAMSAEAAPSAFTELLQIREAVEAVFERVIESRLGRAHERMLFQASLEQLIQECKKAHRAGLDVLMVVQNSKYLLKFDNNDATPMVAEKSSQSPEEKLHLRLS
jgi:hypothetical protein